LEIGAITLVSRCQNDTLRAKSVSSKSHQA
jgi:hypothetical protein